MGEQLVVDSRSLESLWEFEANLDLSKCLLGCLVDRLRPGSLEALLSDLGVQATASISCLLCSTGFLAYASW